MTAGELQIFEPDGRAIPFLEEGEGPVRAVLLPALGLGITSFVTVAHFLEEQGFHLLRIGVRQTATEGLTLHDLARDVVDVMEHVGFDTAWIVGHAFGGALARTVALDHPERVGGVALLGVESPDTGLSPALESMATDASEQELRDAARVLAGDAVDADFAYAVLTRHRLPDAGRLQRTALASTPAGEWAELAPSIPILVVQGTADVVGLPASAENLQASAPERVSVTVVEGAGHLGVLTHPGEVGFAIEDYLAWD